MNWVYAARLKDQVPSDQGRCGCRRQSFPGPDGSGKMRASHNLSGVSVSCDEPNLVSGAGLLPAAVLAQKIGLAELIEQRVRPAWNSANGGAKALTVVGSMLLGGDSVADTAVLAASATGEGVRPVPRALGDRIVAAGVQVGRRARVRRGDPRGAGPAVGRGCRTD